MSFTKETIDLSGLNDDQIKEKLSELNITLTPKEGRKIQDEMLRKIQFFQKNAAQNTEHFVAQNTDLC